VETTSKKSQASKKTANAARKAATKRSTAPKRATATKRAAAPKKPAPAKKVAAKKHGRRADFGAPIDGFFAKQPPQLQPILEELREMVEAAAPDATSSLKWGMPVYSLNGGMMCALGGHKSHVKLILSGPPGAFADPKGRLTGDGKTGRHLKLTSLAELPRADVQRWLKKAAELARTGAK